MRKIFIPAVLLVVLLVSGCTGLQAYLAGKDRAYYKQAYAEWSQTVSRAMTHEIAGTVDDQGYKLIDAVDAACRPFGRVILKKARGKDISDADKDAVIKAEPACMAHVENLKSYLNELDKKYGATV